MLAKAILVVSLTIHSQTRLTGSLMASIIPMVPSVVKITLTILQPMLRALPLIIPSLNGFSDVPSLLSTLTFFMNSHLAHFVVEVLLALALLLVVALDRL